MTPDGPGESDSPILGAVEPGAGASDAGASSVRPDVSGSGAAGFGVGGVRVGRVLDALLAMQRQSWEQGVAAQAALDLGRDELAYLMASSAVARQTSDGRLGGPDDNAVNGAACGEAVVRAGFPDAARRQLGFLLHDAPRTVSTDLPSHAREVLDACLALRRDDGLFHDVLDDHTSFRETNAAQMFAYAALTGAADGWLPDTYAAVGRDLLAAATREVDEHGLVRNACGAPTFDRPGTSAEAQAFHLLATVAAE